MTKNTLIRAIRRPYTVGIMLVVGVAVLALFSLSSLSSISGASNALSLSRIKTLGLRIAHYDYPWVQPSVQWAVAPGEDYGINSSHLNQLSKDLASKKTRAFIVVKNGDIVHESYNGSYHVNEPHHMAALAKAVTGSMVVAAAVDEGYIRLDDPAHKYIPQWQNDPQKSKITLAQLAAHTSGLDDVEFRDDVTPQWKRVYYGSKHSRFPMALDSTPVIVEPGTRYSYSGVGYYALAYAITRSLQDAPEKDIYTFLNNNILRPLGVTESAWTLNYGESYKMDGMTLYAAGSGADYTPRTVARIGQLMLNQGIWNGEKIISPETVDELVSYESAPERTLNNTTLESGIGWISNTNGYFPALPRDAYMGIGASHQILLVVPSLDLVVVRMGGRLGQRSDDPNDFWKDLDEHLYSPLMDILR